MIPFRPSKHSKLLSSAKLSSIWCSLPSLVLPLVFLSTTTPSLAFSAPVAKAETLRIGIIQDLSGPSSVRGESFLKVFRLAQEKIQQTLGTRIEFIIQDDSGNPSKAIEAFRFLKAKGVGLIIGSTTLNCTNAILPLASQLNTVLISNPPSIHGVRLGPSEGNAFVVTMQGNQDEEALRRILVSRKVKRVSLVSTPVAEAEALTFLAKRLFKELNVEIVDDVTLESLYGDALDEFYAHTSIHKVDLIVVFTGGQEIEHLLLAGDGKHNNIPVFTDSGVITLYRKSKRREGYQNVCFAYPYARFIKEKELNSELKEKYNIHPQSYLDTAYDTLFIAVEALREAIQRKVSIREAMQSVRVRGIVGEYSYSKDSSLSLGRAETVCIEDGALVLRSTPK